MIGHWPENENTAGGRHKGDDSLEVAAMQRRLAANACKVRDWDSCERALNRAAVLDLEGDGGEGAAGDDCPGPPRDGG
jgi:hypothetical protein